MNYVLETLDVSKSFAGVNVLNQINFHLCKGEVHALLGENGAGKSTLMKIIIGEYSKDNGEIYYEGKLVHIPSPAKALQMGIAMVHQELHSIAFISVADYLSLGREPRKIGFLGTGIRPCAPPGRTAGIFGRGSRPGGITRPRLRKRYPCQTCG